MECFKFLGTITSSDLGRENNTDAVVKKTQQRLYFLHQLKNFRLRRKILIQFYHSAIESILAFSICVWFGSISQRQRSRLDRMVKTASKIIGSELTPLTDQNKSWQYYLKPNSPHSHLFKLLVSGKRFRRISTKANRFRIFFYLHVDAIAALSGAI